VQAPDELAEMGVARVERDLFESSLCSGRSVLGRLLVHGF
jgi:hypothetical protein